MHDDQRQRAGGVPSGPFGYRVCDGCGVAIQRRLAGSHECDPGRYAKRQAARLHWKRTGFEDAFRRWLDTPAGHFAQYDARRLVRGTGVPRPGEA